MFLHTILVSLLCSPTLAVALAAAHDPALVAADKVHALRPPAVPRGGIPGNDPCTGAFFLQPGSSVVDSTIIAAPDAAPFCVVADSAPGVWYYTVGTGYQMTLTTCHPSTNYDTMVRVYCGTCGALTCVGGNDDQPGPFDPACNVTGIGLNRGSTVTWCSQQGAVYYILIHGFSGNSGGFGLELTNHDDQAPCTGGVQCGGDVLGACCANEGLACTPAGFEYPSCGGSFDCGCFETTEGDGACINFFQYCEYLPTCTTTADCPAGYACLVNTGCDDEFVCALTDCVMPHRSADASPDARTLAGALPDELPAARGLTAQCAEVSEELCNAYFATYHGDGTTCETFPCCSAPIAAFDPQPPDGATAQPTELTFNGGCPTAISVQQSLFPSAYVDTWMFTAAPGTQVEITVNTVSAATAFDPAFCLSERSTRFSCMTLADDTFPCAFPPPAFSCPYAVDTLDPDDNWQYFLTVYSASSEGNFAGPVGEYALTINANGPICGLTLVADNRTPVTSGLPRELRQAHKMTSFNGILENQNVAQAEMTSPLSRDGVALGPDVPVLPLPADDPPPPAQDRSNVLIDSVSFDDFTAPSNFNQTTRLTNRYAAQGVVFVGPGGNDGGAVLNQAGNFGVTGHSPPNFLAFNSSAPLADGGIPRGPEYIYFSPPVTYVSAYFGSFTSAGFDLTMTAYDEFFAVLESDSLTLASQLAPLDVSAPRIAVVEISTSAPIFVMDDLVWAQCRDVYSISFGTTNPPLSVICSSLPVPWCDPGPLVDGTTYYWQVHTLNCCNTTSGPVWSFTAGDPGCPCADFTGDNLVNLVDFVTFQVCFDAVGPNLDCPPEAFACGDLNADGRINLVDFVTFQTIFFLTPDGITPPDCLTID